MKVSVIIPVYNKARYLQTLFKCLLNQTMDDFECILVDDGSTDESGTLCDTLYATDKRFRIVHIPNGGVSHARNVGISKARGDYITFIDADDSIPENYLECLYRNIIESRTDLVICSITKIWDYGKRQSIELPLSGVSVVADLFPDFATFQKNTGVYGYCCGKIFPKRLVEDVQFDEQIHLAEDFDFFLKLYPKMSRICFTNETTYYYLQESENSSSIVDDSSIDYRAQLSVNLGYKHFLEKENVYSGDNRKIVSQLLSNYIFYTLFYCDIHKLNDRFMDLQTVYKNEHIETHGRNMFEKWILGLFSHNQFWLVKISLKCYRSAKKLRRRR